MESSHITDTGHHKMPQYAEQICEKMMEESSDGLEKWEKIPSPWLEQAALEWPDQFKLAKINLN